MSSTKLRPQICLGADGVNLSAFTLHGKAYDWPNTIAEVVPKFNLKMQDMALARCFYLWQVEIYQANS